MAVRHGYGKIAGADALVFAYDTGDTRNSYRGEPTENFANTDTARTLVKHDASSVMTFADAPEKGPGWKKVTITERSANNYRYAQFPYISNPGGTQRTYSVEYDAGSLTGYGWKLDGTGGYGIVNFTGTGRYQMTITPGATGVYALFLTNGSSATGINDTIYYRFYQVENNSHATPFTAGTRSATQGLLDLTGNSTIDVSNTTYDSDAISNLVLDGTDDSINLGSYLTGIDTSELTIELVFRTTIGTAGMVPLIGWHAGESQHGYICTGNFTGMWGNESISFYNEGSNTTPLSFAYTNGHSFYNDSVYHHAVFVLKTGEYKIFVDGEEKQVNSSFRNGSMSTTFPSNLFGYGSTPSVEIGAGSSGPTYGNLRVPVTKIYNRALTAAEVKNNYSNYKGRFNL